MLAVLADDGRGIGGQRGQADDRLAGGQRNAARGGKADTQAGKAAGTGGHRDAVERGEGDARFLHHARDQRHQRFGMAALHRLRFLRDELLALVSSTAAAQASSAVSMARISMAPA